MEAATSHFPVGLILLAAGESRRMGAVKQLLPFAGTTLLRHACHTALKTAARPVIVVLGANQEVCAAEIADLPVTWVYNPQWSEGMGASLRVGIDRLAGLTPRIEGAMVLLADQPLVAPEDLMALLAVWHPVERTIAAAAYNGVLGVPAVFARSHFRELRGLRGAEGARAVIARHTASTASVEIPAAAHDLDNYQDYQNAVGLLASVRAY